MKSTRDIERLADTISGAVVAPGDAAWDDARQAWNLAVDQHPAAVAVPTSVADVVAVVDFARAGGLRVAAQGTGHGAGLDRPLDDAILLKTVRMARVEVDAAERRARVEPGALWGDLAVQAGRHGLAGLAGSSSDVGVVGYTLAGGIGWLGRRYGLASNSVVALDVVTADGRPVRVDPDHEPDLFWALRGGGGSFGVVTTLELELYPVGEAFAGLLVWPGEQAAEVLEQYRVWTATVPEDLTSIVRFLNLPPLPEVPEPMRGRPVIAVDAAYVGSARDGDELMRPLRAAGPAVIDSFGTIAAADLRSLHGDPEQPTAGITDACLLRELPAAAVETLIEVGGPSSGSPLISLELRHLGGALADARPGHGALRSLEGAFALVGVGGPTDPASAEAIHSRLDAVLEAMRPWSAERRYLGFGDRPADPASYFPAETYRRLREVKQRYDPDDVLRSNHPIPPPG